MRVWECSRNVFRSVPFQHRVLGMKVTPSYLVLSSSLFPKIIATLPAIFKMRKSHGTDGHGASGWEGKETLEAKT